MLALDLSLELASAQVLVLDLRIPTTDGSEEFAKVLPSSPMTLPLVSGVISTFGMAGSPDKIVLLCATFGSIEPVPFATL